jgi:hypothetical protein
MNTTTQKITATKQDAKLAQETYEALWDACGTDPVQEKRVTQMLHAFAAAMESSEGVAA